MDAVNEFFLTASNYLWVGVLCLIAWSYWSRKLDLSAQLAMFAWLLDDTLTIASTTFLFGFSDDVVINRTVYYLTLTILSTSCLVFIAISHKVLNISRVSEIAKLVSAGLAILVLLNALRYFDRVIFELDALKSWYRFGVLSIKVCALPMLLTYILKYPRRYQFAN